MKYITLYSVVGIVIALQSLSLHAAATTPTASPADIESKQAASALNIEERSKKITDLIYELEQQDRAQKGREEQKIAADTAARSIGEHYVDFAREQEKVWRPLLDASDTPEGRATLDTIIKSALDTFVRVQSVPLDLKRNMLVYMQQLANEKWNNWTGPNKEIEAWLFISNYQIELWNLAAQTPTTPDELAELGSYYQLINATAVTNTSLKNQLLKQLRTALQTALHINIERYNSPELIERNRQKIKEQHEKQQAASQGKIAAQEADADSIKKQLDTILVSPSLSDKQREEALQLITQLMQLDPLAAQEYTQRVNPEAASAAASSQAEAESFFD